MNPSDLSVNGTGVTALIGRSPLFRIGRNATPAEAEIWGKAECLSPGGSVKDRVALAMITRAEADGRIGPDTVIIEPTSGNTGIGLALVCASRGYRLTIVMPDTMSLERIFMLRGYGAEVVLSPGGQGMPGAIQKAQTLLAAAPRAFLPDQFSNAANPETHMNTTGPEIWEQMDGRIDAFVAGVGTGGTITGVGTFLKSRNPAIRIIAVEPAGSAVLSGGRPGTHHIQGIGAGFVPKILNRAVIDEVLTVRDQDAYETTHTLARTEGLFCGLSSGAAVWAAQVIARRLGAGRRVVTDLPDRGDRYFSSAQYFEF